MSGHWLAVWLGWIWNSFLVGTTEWAWGWYASASIDPGFFHWYSILAFCGCAIFTFLLWAVGGGFMFGLWGIVWLCWAGIWIIVLFVKLVIFILKIVWSICVWLWPIIVWLVLGLISLVIAFCKVFGLPVIAGLLLDDMLHNKDWRWNLAFYILYPSYFVGLFLVFPLGWAIWFYLLTIPFFYLFAVEVRNQTTLTAN